VGVTLTAVCLLGFALGPQNAPGHPTADAGSVASRSSALAESTRTGTTSGEPSVSPSLSSPTPSATVTRLPSVAGIAGSDGRRSPAPSSGSAKPTVAVAPAPTAEAVAPAITPHVEATPWPADAAATSTVASPSAGRLARRASARLLFSGRSEYEGAELRQRGISNAGSGVGGSGPADALFGLLCFMVGQLIMRLLCSQDSMLPTVVVPLLEHPG
jgi:hypothetical protein